VKDVDSNVGGDHVDVVWIVFVIWQLNYALNLTQIVEESLRDLGRLICDCQQVESACVLHREKIFRRVIDLTNFLLGLENKQIRDCFCEFGQVPLTKAVHGIVIVQMTLVASYKE
jgi:hypothetical protein